MYLNKLRVFFQKTRWIIWLFINKLKGIVQLRDVIKLIELDYTPTGKKNYNFSKYALPIEYIYIYIYIGKKYI